MITWKRKMAKGSSGGTGWLTLPAKLRAGLALGQWYDAMLCTDLIPDDSLSLSVKLTKTKESWGFYIPQALCRKYNLLGHIIDATLEKSSYFPCKISEDKRVRIHLSIVQEHQIRAGDCYEVELKVGGEIYQEVVLITSVDRTNRDRADEYFFLFRLQEIPIKTDGQFKFLSKIAILSPDATDAEMIENKLYLPGLFPDATMAKLGDNRMQIFLGNHVPIITPIFLNILELVHYFGCYYADGTKVGPGWSISASTPEQALYYENIYKKLVKGEKLSYNLTYTKKPFDQRSLTELSDDLINYWKENANINLKTKSIKIIESESDETRNWNKFGSIRIRDHRSLLLKFHINLMEKVKLRIMDNENLFYKWQFLFGLLEGDGNIGGGVDRCRISLTCRKSDIYMKKYIDSLNIKYLDDEKKYKDRDAKDYSFGLIPILKNISIIKNNLFIYYPKRRRIFLQRFLNLASIQYLLGEIDNLFILALHPLRENGLVDNEHLRIELLELKEEFMNLEFA